MRLRRIEPFLRRALRGPCRLPPGARLLVAVSGGADSTALLVGLARIAPDRRVVFRSNSTASLHAAARQGVGVAVLPRFLADCDRQLSRLEGPEPASHELWLLVHGDLRQSPRVRAVIEWVDELVEHARPALSGRP